MAVFFVKNGKFGAYGCCKLCLRDLCVPKIYFFRIQNPQNRRAVFNPLSEAKKNHFLTQKRPFLAVFSMRNGKLWCIRMLQNVLS